jgi:hypothetical protein
MKHQFRPCGFFIFIMLTMTGLLQAGEPIPVLKIAQNGFFRTIGRSASGHPMVNIPIDEFHTILDLGSGVYPGNAQHMILSGGRLLVHVSATGLVYAADDLHAPDSIVFRRLDHTTHYGYNFSAYDFSFKDQLYNFGGYGFWRWNGQLRAFNSKMKEWAIIPLNREIPVASLSPDTFMWYDRRTDDLYTLQYIQANEAVRNEEFKMVDSVYVLDLETFSWKALGAHTEHLRNKTANRQKIVEIDSGILMLNQGVIEYFDLPGNRILTLDVAQAKAELLSKVSTKFTWYANGKIYYGLPRTGAIDSVTLTRDMFRDTGMTIYELRATGRNGFWLLIPVLIAGGVFIYRKRGLRNLPAPSSMTMKPPEDRPETEPLPVKTAALPVFDEVELSLLRLLTENMRDKGKRTNVQEVNRILGVANKTLDMQKRKRSDVIRSVNRKFRLVHPDRSEELILKAKSEMDGRLTDYFVNDSETLLLEQFIGKNNR